MIYFKDIIVAVALVLFFSILLGLLFGSLGSYAGFFIATMTFSYLSRFNLEKGAFYGSLAALGAGLIFYLSMVIMGLTMNMGPGQNMLEMGLQSLIIGLMVNGIIGAGGGILGSLVYYYQRVSL